MNHTEVSGDVDAPGAKDTRIEYRTSLVDALRLECRGTVKA